MPETNGSAAIADLLAELSPHGVVGGLPVRLGNRGDGGYVILADDRLEGLVLYSYGIGDNDSFDRDFHRRFGGPVRQYDHTVPPPPERDGFRFFAEGIAAAAEPGRDTLQGHLQNNGDRDRRFVLKMDVEGAEWDVLRSVPDTVLTRCDLLVLEAHDLACLGRSTAYPVMPVEEKVRVLRRLNRHFYCWHVHANNYASVHVIGGFKVPDVMEITWLNRTRYVGHAGRARRFPTALDDPCQSRCYDHRLDFWPFLPGAERGPTARPSDPREIVAREKPWLRRRWDRLARAVSSFRTAGGVERSSAR